MKTFLIAMLIGSTVVAPAQAAELVTNGGFEHANGVFTGWTHTTNLLVAGGLGDQHSGSHSVAFGSAEASPDTLSQTLATVAGTTYLLTYWYANQLDLSGPPSNLFSSSFDGIPLNAVGQATDFGYTFVSIAIDASTSSTVLSFSGYNVTGFFNLDDVSVIGAAQDGVPEPAIWALLLVGFGGVGMAMRRRAPALTPIRVQSL